MYQLAQHLQDLIFEFEYNSNRQHFKNVIIPHLKYVIMNSEYHIYKHMFYNNNYYNNLEYEMISFHFYTYFQIVKKNAKKDYYKFRQNYYI